jgi:uncharacterized membrane protein YfcA
MWLGTEMLAAGNVAWLKRLLGAVVVAAGVWFLQQERRRARLEKAGPANEDERPPQTGGRTWTSLPAGLAAGTLAGLFGTGGPPVIVYLKAYRLNKGAFRATLLWYFLLAGGLRIATYLRAGLLTGREVRSALWLLPASLAGMLLGMAIHRRLPERHFAIVVSVLLIFLGALLLLGGGK